MSDYDHLIPFCRSDRQREVLEQVIKDKSVRTAAKNLNSARGSVRDVLKTLEKYAALSGVAPKQDLNYPLSVIEQLSGRSTLIDKETGESKMQWIKTTVSDEAKIQIMRETIEAMKEDVPIYPEISLPEKYRNTDLLNVYVITDYHFGMKSWGEHTGADWDLEIAEDLLLKWFGAAIKMSPPAKSCVFAQMGDLLHFDGMLPVTPTHGHILDVDTRFQKVVRVVIRVLRQIINMLCAKYEDVTVLMLEGNHDMASSVWLREWLSAAYENNPRIKIDTSAGVYSCVEHGNTSLFFHHGHRKKQEDLDDVFVSKYRQVFGRTKYSYAHLGHKHHNKLIETNLMTVEQHRTLAAPDQYASDGGWNSGRDAKVITYSAKYGEVTRLIVSPELCNG